MTLIQTRNSRLKWVMRSEAAKGDKPAPTHREAALHDVKKCGGHLVCRQTDDDAKNRRMRLSNQRRRFINLYRNLFTALRRRRTRLMTGVTRFAGATVFDKHH